MRHLYYSAHEWASVNVVDMTWTDLRGYMIQGVEVNRKYRGNGVARRLMAEVLDDADREDTRLYLAIHPDPESTGPQRPLTYDELEAWYRRLGFTPFPLDECEGNTFWRPSVSDRKQEHAQGLAGPGQADRHGGALPTGAHP